MSIEKIKNNLASYKGKLISFRFNGNRNQVEEFTGEIIDMFPSVFIIKEKDNERVKSFSYSDILIRKLIIKS